MAHNLYGERFLSRDVPAWHGLGLVVDRDVTAEEAVRLARLDYGISKLPVVAQVSPKKSVAIPDQYALMRSPTDDDPEWRHFGTVSRDYDVLQNTQIAEIVDMLVKGAGWRLETVGALGAGETVFFAVKAASGKIAKEDVDLYFLVTDKRDGGSALTLAATPVRVVCQNTLSMAMGRNAASVQIRHHLGLFQETSWRVDAVKKAQESGESIMAALRRLEKIRMDEERFARVLGKLLPAPPPPLSLELAGSEHDVLRTRAEKALYYHNWETEQRRKARDEIALHFERLNDQFPKIAHTGWSGFNAVTEWLDHTRGKNEAARARETVFGEGRNLRTKAYKLICDEK